jgi:hypothetical protein
MHGEKRSQDKNNFTRRPISAIPKPNDHEHSDTEGGGVLMATKKAAAKKPAKKGAKSAKKK